MCPILPYVETKGSLYSHNLSTANTKMGCDMTDTLNNLKGGKKKTYRYSNGISYYVRKKSHKARRSKTHVYRRFIKNKFSKKSGLAKTSSEKRKSCKEKYGRHK
jgi:hypothetical protein